MSGVMGMDLGLCSGWAIWDDGPKAWGTVDVRGVEGEQPRMTRWWEQVEAAMDAAKPEAIGYEEVRHMTGQGARYILMQQGTVLVNVAPMLCAGINVATLKSYARRYRVANPEDAKALPPPLRSAGMMRHHLATFYNQANQMTEDEAMATWVGMWLAGEVGPLG